MQNEWAGAQEFSSFDSYRAPFTNLTFDWVCPEYLREQVTVIGEVEQDFNHGDLAEEMAVINRASIDVMTAKFGTPYFQNFIPGDHRKHVQPGGHTGGTVLHLYMSEKLCTAAAWRELVQRSLTTHRLPYITVTPSFSICPDHGYLAGEHPTCTVCGGVCEVWTIVMGHFRPVSSFSIGKKGERERSADRGTCGTVHLRLAAGQASRPARRGGLLGWGAHPARTTVDPMIMPPGEVRGSAPRSPPWACGNTCCRLCGPKVPAPRSRRG